MNDDREVLNFCIQFLPGQKSPIVDCSLKLEHPYPFITYDEVFEKEMFRFMSESEMEEFNLVREEQLDLIKEGEMEQIATPIFTIEMDVNIDVEEEATGWNWSTDNPTYSQNAVFDGAEIIGINGVKVKNGNELFRLICDKFKWEPDWDIIVKQKISKYEPDYESMSSRY